MQASGLVDIQSHSMTHNWYYSGETITDFYSRDEQCYYWLAWLVRPDRKPFWMNEDQRDMVTEGTPIFKYGQSLGIRRYFPDEKSLEYSRELFRKSNRLSKHAAIAKYLRFMIEAKPSGYLENDEEMIARYREELKGSKTVLEEKLNKSVNYLCWPGGAYNDISLLLAEEAGYKATTIASRERWQHIDNIDPQKRIIRASIGSSFQVRGRRVINSNSNALVRSFQELEGRWYLKYSRYAKKVSYYLKPAVSQR